jgi:hypothetical protein
VLADSFGITDAPSDVESMKLIPVHTP